MKHHRNDTRANVCGHRTSAVDGPPSHHSESDAIEGLLAVDGVFHLALRHVARVEAVVGTGVGPLLAVGVAAVQDARHGLAQKSDVARLNHGPCAFTWD